MNCPACNQTLEVIHVQALAVDVCRKGCGGLWFDAHEFKKVDEEAEATGAVLTAMMASYPVLPARKERYHCPRDGMIMMRNFYSVNKKVSIDTCPACAGIWLDHGELATIRNEFKTETARKDAFASEFSHKFGTDIKVSQVESENQRKTFERVGGFVWRFIEKNKETDNK